MSHRLPLNRGEKCALGYAIYCILFIVCACFAPWPKTLIPITLALVSIISALIIWDKSVHHD